MDKNCKRFICVIIIFLIKLCKDIQCQSHEGYSIEVNTRIIVQEHCGVSIPCSFKAANKNSFTNSTGFWIKNKDIVASSRNSNMKSSKSNFKITGNPDNGDCTLTITDARKEDSGMYYFRFEGHVKFSYQIKPIMVNVTDQPKKPEAVITVDGVETNRSMLIKDGNLTLNCSAGGKRPTKVTWIKGNSEISSWSTITITPSEPDTYVCLAWDENGFSEKQLQINTKVNSTRQEKTDLLCGKENNERIFDLLIGTVCGIAIVIFSILALKLVAWKYFKIQICLFAYTKYDATEGVPAEETGEDNLNKIYSKPANSKPIIQIPKDADEYQDPNSIPDNEDNIHYSNIVFPGHPFRALSMQPETEYAVIIK